MLSEFIDGFGFKIVMFVEMIVNIGVVIVIILFVLFFMFKDGYYFKEFLMNIMLLKFWKDFYDLFEKMSV